MNDLEAAFRDFRNSPGSRTLLSLLRTCQLPVFNLCYHTLGHLQDAEDAAQEALIKIAEGTSHIREPRAFRRWMYLVSVNTAINHRLKRARQKALVKERLEMSEPISEPLQTDLRDALTTALASLDGELRCLVVEHYFEKTTLEELGRRHRRSVSAIWERIGRAKEQLKRSLAGAGLAIAIPQVDVVLESIVPLTAAPNLIRDAVIAKVTMLSLTGGIIVGTKTSLSVATIVTLMICLSFGIVGGIVVLARRSGSRPTSNPTASTRSEVAQAQRGQPSERVPAGAVPPPGDDKQPTGTASPLRARLEDFRKRLDQEFPDRATLKESDPIGYGAYWRRLMKWKRNELEGMKELILSDPASFLAFFQSTTEGDYLEGVLEILFLGDSKTIEYSTLPMVLMEGLRTTVRSGTNEQKTAILEFVNHLTNTPDAFAEAWRALISDPDMWVQHLAINQVMQNDRALSKSEIDVFHHLAITAASITTKDYLYTNPIAAGAAIQTLVEKRVPGFEDILFGIAASTENYLYSLNIIGKLTAEYSQRRRSDTAFGDRLLGALDRCFAMAADTKWLAFTLSEYVGHFPPMKLLPLLERAAAIAPTSRFASGVRAVSSAIQSGTTDPEALRKLLSD